MKLPVKLLLIFNLITSPILLWAQSDSIQAQKKPNAMIAVDVFSPVYGLFTDRQGFEALATYPITHKIHLAAEAGYEKNVYDHNHWQAHIAGPYMRLGGQYFISQDIKNPNMGYYVGARVAYASFKKTIDSYIILDKGGNNENNYSSLPEHDASSVWFEPLAGGRVQIRETPFYIDASVRLKISLYDNNDYGVDPLIIPGFGKVQSGLGIGVNWSIGYTLPF